MRNHGTPVRGGICHGVVLCPKCQPTEQDVYDIKAMDGLRRTASGRDLACLCKSQLTPGVTRTVPASDATVMMEAGSQSSAYTVVEEQSGAGSSDFRDVEMAGDGSDSGTADFGMGSAVVGETRKRKKTSPALDMSGDLQSDAAGDLWKAVSGLSRWEENSRSNIARKRKIDLAAFVEVSLAIERACTKMEAREAFLVGRLAERSEIRDVVADEVQREMQRIESNIEERRPREVRQPTFKEVEKPKVSFPNLNVRARPRENVVLVYPPGGPKEGPRDTSVDFFFFFLFFLGKKP